MKTIDKVKARFKKRNDRFRNRVLIAGGVVAGLVIAGHILNKYSTLGDNPVNSDDIKIERLDDNTLIIRSTPEN